MRLFSVFRLDIKVYWLALLLLPALLLVGCTPEDIQEHLIPKEEVTFAKGAITQLRLTQLDELKSRMHPDLLSKVSNEKLISLAKIFPDAEPKSVVLMGSNVRTVNQLWSANFSFEYEFSQAWSVVKVSVVKQGEQCLITGMQVYQTQDSQRNINAFSKVKITAPKIAALFLTLTVPVFMLFSCFSVYRSPIEHKWRWYLASFLGVGAFTLNWTTGDFYSSFSIIKLLGFKISAHSEYAPFLLSFTFPIGALWFWIRRKKLIHNAAVNSCVSQSGGKITTHE